MTAPEGTGVVPDEHRSGSFSVMLLMQAAKYKVTFSLTGAQRSVITCPGLVL